MSPRTGVRQNPRYGFPIIREYRLCHPPAKCHPFPARDRLDFHYIIQNRVPSTPRAPACNLLCVKATTLLRASSKKGPPLLRRLQDNLDCSLDYCQIVFDHERMFLATEATRQHACTDYDTALHVRLKHYPALAVGHSATYPTSFGHFLPQCTRLS